jgi:hypothetical protein
MSEVFYFEATRATAEFARVNLGGIAIVPTVHSYAPEEKAVAARNGEVKAIRCESKKRRNDER